MILTIDYALGEEVLSNKAICSHDGSDIRPGEIYNKVGIHERPTVGSSQSILDLMVEAALPVVNDLHGRVAIVVCTQSSPYHLPSLSCLLQNELELKPDIAAFDINQGCSGYIYSLMLGTSLLKANQCDSVLVLTGDTYSKMLKPSDLKVRTLFGDASSATVLSNRSLRSFSPFVFGTDGSGFHDLYAKNSLHPDYGNDSFLHMNGPSIFAFTLREIPKLIKQTCESSDIGIDEIDWFVFHQANGFMLQTLAKTLKIDSNKFIIDLDKTGNTTSSSIPIVMSRMIKARQLQSGDRVCLVGFGVGLSWGGTIVTW